MVAETYVFNRINFSGKSFVYSQTGMPVGKWNKLKFLEHCKIAALIVVYFLAVEHIVWVGKKYNFQTASYRKLLPK